MAKKKDKRKMQQSHEAMIRAYMNIFNASREDAIAMLRAHGLIPSSDKKEKK